MKAETRVLCIDDNPDLTEMLRYVIRAESKMQCVGCLRSADDLSEEVRRLRPDIVLLDATMPGKEPLAALRELAAEFPEVKTIVYSGLDSPEFIDHAIDAGAWGFVSKRQGSDAVVRAVREVAAGNTIFPGRSGIRPRPTHTR